MKAIVNGNVYTPDQVLAPGTVLIEEKRITAVGSADTLTAPTEAKTVDCEEMRFIVHWYKVADLGNNWTGPRLG